MRARGRRPTPSSPCAFHYGRITSKNLEPEPKNPIIANFFHQIRLADELGSGVRNLYHYVKIYSNAEPVFDEDDVFRLTVPLDDAYSADRAFASEFPQAKTAQEAAHETVEKTAEKTVEKILSAMRVNPSITQQQLVEAIGLSRRGIEWQLNQLKAKGIIRRVGPDKGGHWEVI